MMDLGVFQGWIGWHIGPYRRSNLRYLHSPHGECFTPDEISQIRQLLLDNDYLKARVEALEAAINHPSMRGQMELLGSVATFLGGLAAHLNEPSALLRDPVHRRNWSDLLDSLKGNKAISDQTVKKPGPISVLEMPKRSHR